MKKILLGVASAGTGALLFVSQALAAPMSSSTLGANIDSVNGTVSDYFSVLLEKYWPFVVGFVILVGVWHYGKGIISAFLGR